MGILVRDYELFFMKQTKFITDMFTCFTNILNAFKPYGKKYSLGEKI